MFYRVYTKLCQSCPLSGIGHQCIGLEDMNASVQPFGEAIALVNDETVDQSGIV